MTHQLDKELAFVELASQVLDYSETEKNHMIKFVKRGGIVAPQLWEMIVEEKTGSKFIDEEGKDFEDGSDAKTSTCSMRESEKGYISYKGTIHSVGNKTGYLRVAIYNDCVSEIHYFLIPKKNNCRISYYDNDPRGRIPFSYKQKFLLNNVRLNHTYEISESEYLDEIRRGRFMKKNDCYVFETTCDTYTMYKNVSYSNNLQEYRVFSLEEVCKPISLITPEKTLETFIIG